MPPEQLVREAVTILMQKCITVKESLEHALQPHEM